MRKNMTELEESFLTTDIGIQETPKLPLEVNFSVKNDKLIDGTPRVFLVGQQVKLTATITGGGKIKPTQGKNPDPSDLTNTLRVGEAYVAYNTDELELLGVEVILPNEISYNFRALKAGTFAPVMTFKTDVAAVETKNFSVTIEENVAEVKDAKYFGFVGSSEYMYGEDEMLFQIAFNEDQSSVSGITLNVTNGTVSSALALDPKNPRLAYATIKANNVTSILDLKVTATVGTESMTSQTVKVYPKSATIITGIEGIVPSVLKMGVATNVKLKFNKPLVDLIAVVHEEKNITVGTVTAPQVGSDTAEYSLTPISEDAPATFVTFTHGVRDMIRLDMQVLPADPVEPAKLTGITADKESIEINTDVKYTLAFDKAPDLTLLTLNPNRYLTLKTAPSVSGNNIEVTYTGNEVGLGNILAKYNGVEVFKETAITAVVPPVVVPAVLTSVDTNPSNSQIDDSGTDEVTVQIHFDKGITSGDLANIQITPEAGLTESEAKKLNSDTKLVTVKYISDTQGTHKVTVVYGGVTKVANITVVAQ